MLKVIQGTKDANIELLFLWKISYNRCFTCVQNEVKQRYQITYLHGFCTSQATVIDIRMQMEKCLQVGYYRSPLDTSYNLLYSYFYILKIKNLQTPEYNVVRSCHF